MRIIRYQLSSEKRPHFGWLMGDKIGAVEGDIFGTFRRDEAKIPLESAQLLPPATPSKIICVGRNYAAQRLFQKCGFITKSTELWYHKWFR